MVLSFLASMKNAMPSKIYNFHLHEINPEIQNKSLITKIQMTML